MYSPFLVSYSLTAAAIAPSWRRWWRPTLTWTRSWWRRSSSRSCDCSQTACLGIIQGFVADSLPLCTGKTQIKVRSTPSPSRFSSRNTFNGITHLSPIIATPSLLHYDYYTCHSWITDYCAVCPFLLFNNVIELFIWLSVTYFKKLFLTWPSLFMYPLNFLGFIISCLLSTFMLTVDGYIYI